MALANPLGKAAFADLLKVEDVKFDIEWAFEESEVDGDTLYADLGQARWGAEITTHVMPRAEAEGIKALINSRGAGTLTALIFNPLLPYPSSDPTGAIFGSAAPVIGTITDRSHCAFTGFPNSYQIPFGTYFQAIYDTSRYYLGQFSETKTAHVSTGAVTATEIAPPLPADLTSGAAVTVIKPAGKFRITPNSAYVSLAEDNQFCRVTFAAKQSYAA